MASVVGDGFEGSKVAVSRHALSISVKVSFVESGDFTHFVGQLVC